MRYLIFILSLLASNEFFGQITVKPALASKLQGKNNFNDVWKTVNEHYTKVDTGIQATKEFKKWNRWAWWAVRNLDANGKIIDDYNGVWRVHEDLKRKYSIDERSNTGAWYPLNSSSFEYKLGNIVGTGRVDRIVFHPNDPSIMYVASSGGGLWRTLNNGANWQCLTNSLPNCGVTGVAIDPNNPNTIYIATGDGDTGGSGFFVTNFQFKKSSFGIFKSSNGGTTWSLLGDSQTQMSTRNPYKLIKVNGYSNRFICVTTSGILLTLDNGNTWTIINAGVDFFDIEQDPDDNTILYACTRSSIVKSTDGGLSFTTVSTANISPAPTFSSRTALAFDINNNDVLYFLQLGTNNMGQDRLYRSTDSGINFNQINTTTEIADESGVYMGPLAANGSVVLTGAVNLFRSTDNGSTFADNTNWFANSTTSAQFIHADIHDLAFNPLSNILYAATDGGVFQSNDSGNTWVHISNGLNTLQFYHLDGLDGEGNTFAGGLQDNGSAFTTNAGGKLNFFGYGDGFMPKFNPAASNIIYYIYNQSIAKYDRNTNTDRDILTNQSFFSKIACHPTNSQIAYFGTNANIYKTTNQGSSVSIVGNFAGSGGSAGHSGGLATTPANADLVYAAGTNTIRKSTDAGATWSVISGNSGWSTNFFNITDISTCNSNADILYVSTNSTGNAKVLFTQDGGSTWLNITGSLPSDVIVYSVACHDNGDGYIGTNLGVFYQGISMTDWVPFTNGLPIVEVSDLFINEASNIITASTFGRGLWQSDLYTPCKISDSFAGGISGFNRYQVSNEIISSHSMNGTYGNNLGYRSGNKIRLLPGFSINQGARFEAKIAPCGQGVFAIPQKVIPQTN